MTPKREATEDSAPPPATKKLKASFTCGDSVTVVVGKYIQKTFTIHKDLVCASSNFFLAATSDRWSKAADKTIRLPDHLPDTFEVYVTWLYYDTTDALESVQRLRPVRANETEDTRCQDDVYYMAKAWILGDFLGDYAFKNAVMKSLLQMRGVDGPLKISPVTVNLILKSCPSGSGLYRWLTDMCCAIYKPAFIEQYKEVAPVEFWHDMLRTYMAAPRFTFYSSLLPGPLKLGQYEEHEVASKNEEGEKSKEEAQS